MKYIARHKNLIELIIILTVLLIYKLTNNFVFKNGSSIVFLIIIIGLPATLEIITKKYRKKNLKLKKVTKLHFFEKIALDEKSGKLKAELLKKISSKKIKINKIESEHELNYLIGNQDIISVMFDNDKCKIKIEGTAVEYTFYYNNVNLSRTRYDKKGFSFRDTSYLYKEVQDKLLDLLDNQFEYTSYSKKFEYLGCVLKNITLAKTEYEIRIGKTNYESRRISKETKLLDFTVNEINI